MAYYIHIPQKCRNFLITIAMKRIIIFATNILFFQTENHIAYVIAYVLTGMD